MESIVVSVGNARGRDCPLHRHHGLFQAVLFSTATLNPQDLKLTRDVTGDGPSEGHTWQDLKRGTCLFAY